MSNKSGPFEGHHLFHVRKKSCIFFPSNCFPHADNFLGLKISRFNHITAFTFLLTPMRSSCFDQSLGWEEKSAKIFSHLYLLQPWKCRHKFSPKLRLFSPHQQCAITPKTKTGAAMWPWPPRLSYLHFETYLLFTLSWSIKSNQSRQTDIQPEERKAVQSRTFSSRHALPLQIHTLWI